MEFAFRASVWEWRGPAPFYFVSVPAEMSEEILALSSGLSYGWGAIPALVRVGATTETTAIFPKDGLYAVPMKKALRVAERFDQSDVVDVHLVLGDEVYHARWKGR